MRANGLSQGNGKLDSVCSCLVLQVENDQIDALDATIEDCEQIVADRLETQWTSR